MRHGLKRISRPPRSLWLGLLAPLALICGCGNLLEKVTSKDFQMKDLYTNPNPVEVLRDPASDNARRADALRELREPSEANLQVLTSVAASPREEYYCRLSAIKTLSRYKDVRAAQTLRDVYLQDLPYTPDMVSIMRQQTLTALAETGQDSARELLIRVAKEPPSAGSFKEQQETVDRRLAAIRGLGKFNHPDAVATLFQVLQTDQDVAVGHKAGEALQTATGKNLPPVAEVWERELYAGRAPVGPAAPTPIQQATQRRSP